MDRLLALIGCHRYTIADAKVESNQQMDLHDRLTVANLVLNRLGRLLEKEKKAFERAIVSNVQDL